MTLTVLNVLTRSFFVVAIHLVDRALYMKWRAIQWVETWCT